MSPRRRASLKVAEELGVAWRCAWPTAGWRVTYERGETVAAGDAHAPRTQSFLREPSGKSALTPDFRKPAVLSASLI